MPITPCLQPSASPLKHPPPSDQSSCCMNFIRNYAHPNSTPFNHTCSFFQTSHSIHKHGPRNPNPFLGKNSHHQLTRFAHMTSHLNTSQRRLHGHRSFCTSCAPGPCSGTLDPSSGLPAPYSGDSSDTTQSLVQDPGYCQNSPSALQPDYFSDSQPFTASPHPMYYHQPRLSFPYPQNYSASDSENIASCTKDCTYCFNLAHTMSKDVASDADNSDSTQNQGQNSITHSSYMYFDQSITVSSSKKHPFDATAASRGCKHSKSFASSSPKASRFTLTTNSDSSITSPHLNTYKLYESREKDSCPTPFQSNVSVSIPEKSTLVPDDLLHNNFVGSESRTHTDQLKKHDVEKGSEVEKKSNKSQPISAIGLPNISSTHLKSLPFSSFSPYSTSSNYTTAKSVLDSENHPIPTTTVTDTSYDNDSIDGSATANKSPLNSVQDQDVMVSYKVRDFSMPLNLSLFDICSSTKSLGASSVSCSSERVHCFRSDLSSYSRLDDLLLESDSLNSQLESAGIACTIIEKRFKDQILRNHTLKHLTRISNEELNVTKTEMKEAQAKLDAIKVRSESVNKEINRLREERISRDIELAKVENMDTMQINRRMGELRPPVQGSAKNIEAHNSIDENPSIRTNQDLLASFKNCAEPQEPYYKLERPLLVKNINCITNQKSASSYSARPQEKNNSNVLKPKPPLRQVDFIPGYYYDLNLSPLRAFRAFRFCEWFPWKNLLSVTWSNNLDPYRKLCILDLRGRCNAKCDYQHEEEYILSKKELLEEYLSYLDSSNATQLEELRSDNRPLLEKLVKIVRLVRQQINSPSIVYSLALRRRLIFRNRCKRKREETLSLKRRNDANSVDLTQESLDRLFRPSKMKKKDIDEIRDQADVIHINTTALDPAPRLSTDNDQTIPGSVDDGNQKTLNFGFFSSLIDELNLSNLAGQPANEREDALIKLSSTLEEYPTVPLLWVCYLHIFLRHSQQKEDVHEAFDRAMSSCPNCSIIWVYGITHIPFTSYLSKLKFIKKSVEQFKNNRCNSFGFMECLAHLLTFSNDWSHNQSLLSVAFTYDWLEPRYRLACKLWIFYYIGHRNFLPRNELLLSITSKSYLFDWTNLKKSALERLEKGISKLLLSAEFKDIPLLLDNAFAFYAQNGWMDRAISLSAATSEVVWQIKAKIDKARLTDTAYMNSIEHSKKCMNPEYVYENARAILYLDLGLEGLENILSMIRTLVYVKPSEVYSTEPLSDQDTTKIWAHFCYLLLFPLKRLFPNKSATVLSYLQNIFTSTERSRMTKNPHWWLCFIIFSTITNPFDTHLRTKIQEVSRNMLGFEKLTPYLKEYTWVVLSIINVYQCQITVMADDKKANTDLAVSRLPLAQLSLAIQKSMADVSDNQSLLFISLSHTLSYLTKKPTNEHPFLYTFNREYVIEITKQLELSNMTLEQAFKLVKKAQVNILRDWSGINQCVRLFGNVPHLLPEIYNLCLKKSMSTNIDLLLESYKNICKRSGLHGHEYFERTVLPVFKKQKNCDITIEQWTEVINIAAKFNQNDAKFLLKDAISIHPWSDAISALHRQICQDDENEEAPS